MKRILSILIAALLALSLMGGAALAEGTAETEQPAAPAPEFDLKDLTVHFGSKNYTFPMTVEQCGEVGISVSAFNPLSEGTFYSAIDADNGRSSFQLRIELIDGEHWATGVVPRMDRTPGATIGGVVIGETTRAQLLAGLGEPHYSGSNNVSYRAFGGYIIWDIYFESDAADAVVSRLTAYSKIPGDFGAEFSDLAGVEADDLPDVTSMAFNEFILDGKCYAKGSTIQDLLDNGWVLPKDKPADSMIEGSAGFLVHGVNDCLYNGKSLVRIGAYNFTAEAVPFSSCIITEVLAYEDYDASLILADGITFNSPISDCETTLGAAQSSEVDELGNTTYKFKVLNGVIYEIHVDEEGIFGISLNKLNN